MAPATHDQTVWLPADGGYALAVVQNKLMAKNPKGKVLKSLPKALKGSPLAEQLFAAIDWVEQHQSECLRKAELWMLRSLPIPAVTLRAVWPDPAWQHALRNVVVVPCSAKGELDWSAGGLLREADSKKGLGIVDRDGETAWLRAKEVAIPHPILIEGREDLLELATDLAFDQPFDQLFRPVHAAKPSQHELTSLPDYSGGKFEQLNHCLSLCRRLGYPVRGGYACTKIWENGTPVEARYWIGADDPEGEAYTSELMFVDSAQHPIPIGNVGPVSFSEGIHMAQRIYAKRVVESSEDQS